MYMWRGEIVVEIWGLIELVLIEREGERYHCSLSTKKVRLKLIDKK
jgi:hypothetical protein